MENVKERWSCLVLFLCEKRAGEVGGRLDFLHTAHVKNNRCCGRCLNITNTAALALFLRFKMHRGVHIQRKPLKIKYTFLCYVELTTRI